MLLGNFYILIFFHLSRKTWGGILEEELFVRK
jgi:hypothetical protein